MALLDLRVAWRQLRDHPFNACVLILGLGLALAACYLLAVLLGERLQPDPALKEPERIVMIDFKGNMPGRQEDWFLGAPFVFKPALQAAKAPLTLLSRAARDTVTLRRGERLLRVKALAADADLTELFNLRTLRGDLHDTLARPDRIAVTASLARQLFGDAEPLGQSVQLGQHTLSVGALLPDPGSRSQFRAEAYLSFDSPAAGIDQDTREAWFNISGQVYGRLLPGASAAQVGQVAQALLDASPIIKQLPQDWTQGGRKAAFMRALPVPDMPFEGQEGRLRVQVLTALAGTGALLLLLALLNFVNLSGVRTLRRQREIAVRKSLGLSPARLLLQFAVEAQLTILLACALALLLAWLMVPWLAESLRVPVPDALLQGGPLLGLMGVGLLLGLLVCLYPAWLAWRQNAAAALQGRQASEGQGGRWLRRALTVLQFGIALLVGSLALLMGLQNHHALQRDIGFQPQDVLALPVPESGTPAQAEALRRAVKARPEVIETAWTDSVLASGRIDRNADFSHQGHKSKLRVTAVDVDFFKFFRVPLLAGSLAGAGESTAVLDEAGARALGFASPQAAVGQTVDATLVGLDQQPRAVRILGVVPTLTLESTREPARPHLLELRTTDQALGEQRGWWVLNLRLKPGSDANKVLMPAWQQAFPQEPFNLERVEEAMTAPYEIDRRIAQLISFTGLLALALAGFGVYALSAYLVQRHARELVLRKLHGAGPWQAMGRLAREMSTLLLVGAMLGLPLAGWLGERHLSRFVDRAPVGLLPYALALVGLLLVTGLASLRHGLQAWRMKPILALRD